MEPNSAPNEKKSDASIDDVLNLTSCILRDEACRKILEDVARSDGPGHLKWRLLADRESAIIFDFVRAWKRENSFDPYGPVRVVAKLGLYFTAAIHILRSDFGGIDDPQLAEYLSKHIENFGN